MTQKNIRRIQEVFIEGLFGFFNHKIPFNLDDRITIIHGRNGVGKTYILKIIKTIFSAPDINRLKNIPFAQITITFDDGINWVIKKEKIDSENNENDQESNDNMNIIKTFLIYPSGVFTEEFILSSKINQLDRSTLSRIRAEIDEYIPGIERVGHQAWQSLSTNEVFTLEDLLIKYKDELPTRFQLDVHQNFPDWLENIIGSVSVRIINTDRLSVFVEPRRPSRYGRNVNFAPAVKKYSDNIVLAIKDKLADYATKSQSLDRNFPFRVMQGEFPIGISVEQLNSEINETEAKRKRFMNVGFLDRERELGFDKLQDIKDDNRQILALYIEDVKQKLETFEELAQKFDLLVSIINKRFSYKKMEINKTDGIIINTDTGVKLSPEMLSSGEQHELVLFYELLFNENKSLILIDEPELSLHITWQREFLGDLINIAHISNLDVLIATHAPDIIHNRYDLTVKLDRQEDNE